SFAAADSLCQQRQIVTGQAGAAVQCQVFAPRSVLKSAPVTLPASGPASQATRDTTSWGALKRGMAINARCPSPCGPICRIHVGVGRTRMDDIDGNAFRAEVTGEALGHAYQRSLAQRIEAEALAGHANDELGADRQDAPTLPHVTRSDLR